MKEGKIEEGRKRGREGGSRETETGPDSEGSRGRERNGRRSSTLTIIMTQSLKHIQVWCY